MAVLGEPKDPTGTSGPDALVASVHLVTENWPNPFRNRTLIRYSLPRMNSSAGIEYPTTLNIYNLSNQLVRSLVNGNKTDGSYSVTWDGRDNKGKMLPAGVYLYRVSAVGYTISKKMVLMR